MASLTHVYRNPHDPNHSTLEHVDPSNALFDPNTVPRAVYLDDSGEDLLTNSDQSLEELAKQVAELVLEEARPFQSTNGSQISLLTRVQPEEEGYPELTAGHLAMERSMEQMLDESLKVSKYPEVSSREVVVMQPRPIIAARSRPVFDAAMDIPQRPKTPRHFGALQNYVMTSLNGHSSQQTLGSEKRPPLNMHRSINFERISAEILLNSSGMTVDSFTAFLILMLSSSPTFVHLVHHNREGETALNINRDAMRPFIDQFLLGFENMKNHERFPGERDSFLETSQLMPLYLRCHRVSEREEAKYNEVVRLGQFAPSKPIRNHEEIPYRTRFVHDYQANHPRAEELMRTFSRYFAKGAEFAIPELPRSCGVVSLQDIAHGLVVDKNTNEITFVRGLGWEPSLDEQIFPSKMIVVSGQIFELKGMMVIEQGARRAEEGGSGVYYRSYMFNQDALLEYNTLSERMGFQSFTESAYPLDEFFAAEQILFRGLQAEIRPSIHAFAEEVMRNSDLLLYVKKEP